MNDNTISQAHENASYKFLAWALWLCAGSFYLYQFVVRVSTSVIAEEIMSELSIQACSVGTMASFYYYGYTGMQIPVGLILDRYGVRLPLILAALMCATGCGMFATADSLASMSLGRLLMGIGSAFGFLSCVKTATLGFPANRLSFFIGISMLLGTTGGTGGGAPFALLVSYLNWRNATLVLGAVGLLIAVVVWAITREQRIQPTSLANSNTSGIEAQISIFTSMATIFKKPQTYLFGLYGGLMYVPLSGFADLWGVPYISNLYDVDHMVAAGSVSLFYVGVGAGSPLACWISDRLQSHKNVMIMGGVCLAFTFGAIIYVPHIPFMFTYVLFFLGGVFASSQFLAFASICEINTSNVSATASGIHNMMCMISGIIFQPVIGKLLELHWEGALQDSGSPLYTQADYVFALSIIPICVVIATLLGFWMKETYRK
jgi:sugar phosphate permease